MNSLLLNDKNYQTCKRNMERLRLKKKKEKNQKYSTWKFEKVILQNHILIFFRNKVHNQKQ
jgi:hypothetical protein